MDNIRKKMQSLKYETDELYKNIKENEQVTKDANDKLDRCECDIRDFTKKISKMEGDFEETSEKLTKAGADLLEKSKQHQELESDLSAISRRLMLLEDDVNKSEIKLAKATLQLANESKRADKVVKVVNTATSKAMNDEVEIESLRQVKYKILPNKQTSSLNYHSQTKRDCHRVYLCTAVNGMIRKSPTFLALAAPPARVSRFLNLPLRQSTL